MSTISRSALPEVIVYPDSDGKPMAENTLQFRWIVTIEGGLESLFARDPQVFVAGDLLWYPVEGKPKIRTAPDAMVAFGRPKGRRGSYKQWEEGGIAPRSCSNPFAREPVRRTAPEVQVLRTLWGRGILHLRPRQRFSRRFPPYRASLKKDPEDGRIRQPSAGHSLRTG